MAIATVTQGKLEGYLFIPASKSHTLRAILFAALAEGTSTLIHPLESPDSAAMAEGCKRLGAEIDFYKGQMRIKGIGGEITLAENIIDAGNSGIVLRFLAAIAGLGTHPIVITGDASIRHQRPMISLIKGLKDLGVTAISTKGDGYAPVIIQGPWRGGVVTIQGQDSQPVSSLLIAAAFAPHPTEILVEKPGEKPWIDLTLHWLDRFGIHYKRQGYERYYVEGGSRIPSFTYTVPADLSSASFPVAAALLTGSELMLRNVDLSDCQGDKALIAVFQKMGAKITIDSVKKTLQVHRGSVLRGIDVDINDFIDGICILSVVACYAEGKTRISNAAIARQKECDRIHGITSELRKMGASIEEREDGLTINRSNLTGSKVKSHHDHRMAMSLLVAGLIAEGKTTVEGTECIAKTYPSFIEEMRKLGAVIEVIG